MKLMIFKAPMAYKIMKYFIFQLPKKKNEGISIFSIKAGSFQ